MRSGIRGNGSECRTCARRRRRRFRKNHPALIGLAAHHHGLAFERRRGRIALPRLETKKNGRPCRRGVGRSLGRPPVSGTLVSREGFRGSRCRFRSFCFCGLSAVVRGFGWWCFFEPPPPPPPAPFLGRERVLAHCWSSISRPAGDCFGVSLGGRGGGSIPGWGKGGGLFFAGVAWLMASVSGVIYRIPSTFPPNSCEGSRTVADPSGLAVRRFRTYRGTGVDIQP